MYAQQEVWGTLIALYLFLGGVAGAAAAIGLFTDQFLGHNRRLGVIAAISSFVIVSVGCVFLLADLTQPLNTIYFYMNPGSWIFWGIVFIMGMMVFEALYVLPYMESWPLVGAISRGLAFLKGWQKVTALLGAVCGFAVTVYTGFLLSATPAIPFWNTALLPALFTVSAFSTGLAFLMVMLWLGGAKGHEVGRLGQVDAGVILMEMIVLALFLGLAASGSRPEAAFSVAFLMGNMGFVVGFLLLGVLAPLGLEAYVLVKGHGGAATLATSRANLYLISGLLVLAGGYLLRQYVLLAGFYVKVW